MAIPLLRILHVNNVNTYQYAWGNVPKITWNLGTL